MMVIKHTPQAYIIRVSGYLSSVPNGTDIIATPCVGYGVTSETVATTAM